MRKRFGMEVKMKDEKFWREGMDGKRFALCLFGRIWILPAAAAGCALFAALIYWIVAVGLAGAPEYQVFSQYRIYFDSEKYGQIEDYYNAYTWGEIMKTDQVVDFVMEALPEGITKEQVKESVSVGAMNDVKIMPLYVTCQDPELAETIAQAYVYGLEQFALSIEGLTGMDCWLIEPAEEVPRGTKLPNAAFLGAFVGAMGAFLIYILWYCLDDSIYLEEDLTQRYGCRVLGIITQKKNPAFLRELQVNLTRLPKGEAPVWLVQGADGEGGKWMDDVGLAFSGTASWPFADGEEENMRKGGVLLLLPWGKGGGRMARHVIGQLEKQDIPVLGAVIYGAGDRFLRAYYGKNGGRI